MKRQRRFGGSALRPLVYLTAALVVSASLFLVSGCSAAAAMSEPTSAELEPEPEFKPTRLVPPDTAVEASGNIASPEEEDYFEFTLDSDFGSVTVMTSGTTDTAGRVETADRTPVTEYCDGDDPQPPCIFVYHSDNTGSRRVTNRAEARTGVESSTNFRWIGKLAPGTYYVRVTAERLSRDESGSYALAVEPSESIPQPHPEPAFEPTLLVISPDAATGDDYVALGSIDRAGELDYLKLVLNRSFNVVDVMTFGDTDTSGQVETWQRVPVTTECQGEKAWNSEPPCVWGYDDDIDPPNSDRTQEFNSMPASRNFLWEGSLDAGIYYIRVTGGNGATGAYRLGVESNNEDCPNYNLNHPVCVD